MIHRKRCRLYLFVCSRLSCQSDFAFLRIQRQHNNGNDDDNNNNSTTTTRTTNSIATMESYDGEKEDVDDGNETQQR